MDSPAAASTGVNTPANADGRSCSGWDSDASAAGVYDIGGVRWRKDSPGFQAALAQAHARHLRPRCLCRPDTDALEMYVARRLNDFHLKRMPHTGGLHTPTCASYEPVTEGAGVGSLRGTAIMENPLTGQTQLALGFALCRRPNNPASDTRPNTAPDATARSSGRSSTRRPRLSRLALLHYLWDEAELTRWQPGFAGRRSWATVRSHLLLAAENKCAPGASLRERLYIPEMFSVARRDALQRRRLDQWAPILNDPITGQRLMLLVAEVKDVLPTRDACQVRFKHLPDVPFSVAQPVLDRLLAQHEHALALWRADASLHLLMMSTFGLDAQGHPRIEEPTLMLTTGQWLPVENAAECQLIATLVQHQRRFIKALRYGWPAQERVSVCATLIDGGAEPLPLCISHPSRLSVSCPDGGADPVPLSVSRHPCASGPSTQRDTPAAPSSPAWLWCPAAEAMPPLPGLRP